jgi:uncharacterized protein with PIN domain
MEPPGEPRFACDAMLGALARWLRAAGYDATWRAGIGDTELVRFARAEARTLLTSDGGILLHAAVRDGAVPCLWLPRGLTTQHQLAFVLNKCGLALREPRCMTCGGELREVARDQAAGRVPPRTFASTEQFWECVRCGRLYWHGTHWERIAARLQQAAQTARRTPPS